MTRFDVVLMPEGDRLTPGLGLEAKGTKLVVETVFGKRHTVAPDKLAFRDGVDASSKSEASSILRSLVERADALAAEIDVELLWESVVDRDDAFSLRALAAVWFTERLGLAELKGIDLAVGDGGEFFVRAKRRYRPLSRDQRASVVAKREREAERARAFDAMIDAVRARLDRPDATAVDEARVEEAVTALTSFAIHGSGAGEQIVERVGGSGDGRGDSASRRHVAVELLVRLGAIERPTDLLMQRHRMKRMFPVTHREAVGDVAAAIEAALPSLPAARAIAFTIDDVETRDYDDAISVDVIDGETEFGVHIADPASFVGIGTALDETAYSHGTTVYLPDKKYPMFPPELSEDLLSLRAGAPRPVVSFYFRFPEPDAPPTDLRIVRERITIAQNLRYEDVDRQLAETDSTDTRGVALRLAHRIALGRRADRLARGAVALNAPEVRIAVGDDGTIRLARGDSETPSRVLVSEAMILVNHAGASFLAERAVPAIYRGQSPPSEPVTPPVPYDPVAFRREVRKMKKARLSVSPLPHAGLGLEHYTQLSSPLRRYGDLVIHRQLAAAITGASPPYADADALLAVVVTSDMNYQTAVAAERRAKRAWALRFLEARAGEPESAIVVDVVPGRETTVELTATGVVGRVPGRDTDTLAVGDRVTVIVRAIDAIDEEPELEWAE